MSARVPNIGLQRTAPCGLAAEAASFGTTKVPVVVAAILGFLSTLAGAGETAAHYPKFGSAYAGRSSLHVTAGGFVPKATLRASGRLTGNWLRGHEQPSIVVEEAPTASALPADYCAAWPTDCFLLRVTARDGYSLPFPFVAAYGSLEVFGCDIDQDGIDEIFLEHGEGRGTSVYVKTLTVLKVIKDSVVEVLDLPMNGYLWQSSAEGFSPPIWERRYTLQHSGALSGFDIVVTLSANPSGSQAVARSEDLFALQFPRLVFRYVAKHHSCELVEAPLNGLR